MATADADQDLASTPRWFLSLTASFLAGLLVFGISLIAGSVASYLALSAYYPAAVPFHWLAVFGMTLAFVLQEPTEREAQNMNALAEMRNELDGRAFMVYFGTIMLVFIGLVSFLAGVVGITAAVAAQHTAIGAALVPLALWYPTIDLYLGRTIGINVASIGALFAILLMYGVAIAWHVSPSVPSRAAKDLRRSLGAPRVRS